VLASFLLPPVLRAQLEREAREAIPRECCGLIEGRRDGMQVVAAALHPARNLSDDIDRFEIDPAEHIRLLREMRGTDSAIIGCYHSHPNGMAELSARDRDGASEDGFIWLICGVNGTGAKIGVFVFENGRFRALELRESTSA
jgi:proteasome lid subunit RPN8/RPN11